MVNRPYMFGELLRVLKSEDLVAYCYEGESRGSIAFFNQGHITVITPNNYVLQEQNLDDELISTFELWGFIHNMDNSDIRIEAMNRLYDVYLNFYQYMPLLREFPFRLEK
ncbi:hypothetical protein Q7A53_06075 [Halobacillus rhizosphaerae]|uniref:hypothetical protein n=1 Tax=Halobacillus rhizosphaerae TaxID=3064889 RepID=UPI00398B742C